MMTDILENFGITISNLWVAAALESALIFTICFGLLFLLNRATKHWQKTREGKTTANALVFLHKLGRRLAFVVAFYFAAKTLPLHAKNEWILTSITFVTAVLFTLIAMFDITDMALTNLLKQNGREFIPLTTRLANFFYGLIALTVLLRHFNYDIWHIVTALGIGSLAVGLAAQPTLTNLIAGFYILIDRPFAKGDRIRLSTGEVGDIFHVGLRTTQIQLVEGNMMIVPNSDLANSKVVNLCLPTREMAGSVRFLLDSSVDINYAKTTFADQFKTIDGLSGEPAVLFTSIVDSSYELTVFFKARHFTETGKVADQILETGVLLSKEKNLPLAQPPWLKPRA